MRIDKIKIKNFKGFADNTFELNPNFTVFIGDNAKGKTSALDALAISIGSFLRGIDIAKNEAKGIEKNEIRTLTIDNEPRPQLPVVISAEGEVAGKPVEGEWVRSVDEITKKTTTKFVLAKNIEKIASDMLKLNRSEGGVTFPVLAYHGTGRLWAEHEEKKVAYKQQGEGVALAYTNCLSPKSSSKNFLSWYKTYEDEVRKFNKEEDKALLQSFNDCIISMIPNNEWEEMAFSFKEDDLIGWFTTPAGKKEKLLFSQLSDGYRNVIGMVADIAYRCMKLNPHLGRNAIKDTPGIVLIDELDLHLHPNWQKRIVNDLKKTFPKIQFIATTHSPFIVQSLEANELINLDNDETLSFSPNELPISKIATEIMGIDSVRSDDFDKRYGDAKKELSEIGKSDENLTINDYLKISELLGKIVKDETNDPVYKAYIETKDKNETH